MMPRKKESSLKQAVLLAALALGVMLLSVASAGAVYLRDGAVGTDPLSYDNPKDGMCVVGIRNNAGTAEFLIDKNITNNRDCVAYTTNLTGMTSQANCAPAASGTTLGAGTSGWRHAWSTSVCKDGSGNGISRVDLDSTAAMCTAKGGTIGAACVAYGWLYRGATSGTVPSIPDGPNPAAPFNASNYEVWTGVDYASGHGFCYTAMNFTAAANILNSCTAAGLPYACCTGADAGTCGNADCTGAGAPYACCTGVGTGLCGDYTKPLSATWPDPGNDAACPMFDPNNATGRSRTGTSWSDYYWNWDTSTGAVPPAGGTKCRNAYGVKGKFMSAVSASVMGVAWNNTSKNDLTGITNQAECVAKGLSWEPALKTTGPVDATVRGTLSGTACGTSSDCYYAVDITTTPKNGGGYFVSRQCLKCHSDQSRGMAEFDKPGYIETLHKQAGDDADPVIAGVANAQGTKGVQCAVCHDVTNSETIALINKDDAGNFIETGAHERYTAGSGVTQVCYHCHSDATLGVSANTTPGTVIPVSGGDFAGNGQHLAPIVNQFLNSPHGQYSGNNGGADLRDEAKYASTFIGYNCKGGTASPPIPEEFSVPYSTTGTIAWDAVNCPAAGHTWTGSACVYNAASCAAADPGSSTWDAATSLCYGPGLGGSTSTVYRSGVAEKIPFLDSTTNAACTNAGTVSATSGAAAYWVKEGGDAHTAQGNCATCHDVHWHIGSTIPGAEPLRRECTTCHSNTGTSASSAPQVDLATINHLSGPGTPLENMATHPYEACEICHMATDSGSSAPLHLWRISTDETYETMGATKANLDADGKAWVDLDHACGQCHFAPTKNGALVKSKAVLAAVAKGMHDSAAANCQVTFTIAKSGLTASVDAYVDCSPNPNTDLTYDWDWGDGTTPHGTADPTSHTYAAAGAYSIKLTVKKLNLVVGSVTRSVTVTAPDGAPTVGGTACGSILTADTWAATLNDTSTDDRGIMYVLVNWGDGSTPSRGAQNAALSHTYRKAGSFLITQTAVDTALQASVRTCTVSPASFRIDGTVKTSGAVAIASATVNLFDTANGVLVKTMYSTSLGAFSATSLKPGEYRITVSKRGYTFDVPAATVSVGPSKTGGTAVNIAANP